MKGFWDDVQRSNNKIKNSELIDGKSNPRDVIGIFSEKFLNFLCVQDTSQEHNLLTKLKLDWANNRKYNLKISAVTLRRLINKEALLWGRS